MRLHECGRPEDVRMSECYYDNAMAYDIVCDLMREQEILPEYNEYGDLRSDGVYSEYEAKNFFDDNTELVREQWEPFMREFNVIEMNVGEHFVHYAEYGREAYLSDEEEIVWDAFEKELREKAGDGHFAWTELEDSGGTCQVTGMFSRLRKGYYIARKEVK